MYLGVTHRGGFFDDVFHFDRCILQVDDLDGNDRVVRETLGAPHGSGEALSRCGAEEGGGGGEGEGRNTEKKGGGRTKGRVTRVSGTILSPVYAG